MTMLQTKIADAEVQILEYLRAHGFNPIDTECYGAIDIDPKYLTLQIIFETN